MTHFILLCSYGSTTRPILLDNVRCSGTETRLISCRRNSIGSHNCFHFEDVAINCPGGRVSAPVGRASAHTNTPGNLNAIITIMWALANNEHLNRGFVECQCKVHSTPLRKVGMVWAPLPLLSFAARLMIAFGGLRLYLCNISVAIRAWNFIFVPDKLGGRVELWPYSQLLVRTLAIFTYLLLCEIHGY